MHGQHASRHSSLPAFQMVLTSQGQYGTLNSSSYPTFPSHRSLRTVACRIKVMNVMESHGIIQNTSTNLFPTLPLRYSRPRAIDGRVLVLPLVDTNQIWSSTRALKSITLYYITCDGSWSCLECMDSSRHTVVIWTFNWILMLIMLGLYCRPGSLRAHTTDKKSVLEITVWKKTPVCKELLSTDAVQQRYD